jgi:hypothetical protein
LLSVVTFKGLKVLRILAYSCGWSCNATSNVESICSPNSLHWLVIRLCFLTLSFPFDIIRFHLILNMVHWNFWINKIENYTWPKLNLSRKIKTKVVIFPFLLENNEQKQMIEFFFEIELKFQKHQNLPRNNWNKILDGTLKFWINEITNNQN